MRSVENLCIARWGSNTDEDSTDRVLFSAAARARDACKREQEVTALGLVPRLRARVCTRTRTCTRACAAHQLLESMRHLQCNFRACHCVRCDSLRPYTQYAHLLALRISHHVQGHEIGRAAYVCQPRRHKSAGRTFCHGNSCAHRTHDL